MKHRCPICRRLVQATAGKRIEETRFFPFCSERCKLTDLGAWLDAEYKMACESKSQNWADSNGTVADDSADGIT